MRVAVHCIHTNKREHELLKETKTKMIHALEYNMSNAVEAASSIRLFKENVPIGLCPNGYTSDVMWSI